MTGARNWFGPPGQGQHWPLLHGNPLTYFPNFNPWAFIGGGSAGSAGAGAGTISGPPGTQGTLHGPYSGGSGTTTAPTQPTPGSPWNPGGAGNPMLNAFWSYMQSRWPGMGVPPTAQPGPQLPPGAGGNGPIRGIY